MLGCLLGLVFSGQCLQWSVFRQRSLAIVLKEAPNSLRHFRTAHHITASGSNSQ